MSKRLAFRGSASSFSALLDWGIHLVGRVEKTRNTQGHLRPGYRSAIFLEIQNQDEPLSRLYLCEVEGLTSQVVWVKILSDEQWREKVLACLKKKRAEDLKRFQSHRKHLLGFERLLRCQMRICKKKGYAFLQKNGVGSGGK